ncbi:hypothetical protein C2S53_001520 [Perilla frutescens var. hirtella]|uniref:Uncharacterized protein n=1 Tax=Perilla frutescens var. hirtella TaxID=608512 RepID=A0AAD4J3R9_PERFH|nr:hypothetical protein C2S51_011190 [Perilla frutescens var. frutescens]KAH6826083.1 hypothetical protein C2S53_001520 [Perilla frutescens var. hirtella]
MANSKFSVAILCYAILLLSVGIDAKECNEGLPWVETDCFGEEATTPCWAECYKRHGTNAKAYCRSVAPVLPTQVCWCSWTC